MVPLYVATCSTHLHVPHYGSSLRWFSICFSCCEDGCFHDWTEATINLTRCRQNQCLNRYSISRPRKPDARPLLIVVASIVSVVVGARWALRSSPVA
jgi:hypothetical protein